MIQEGVDVGTFFLKFREFVTNLEEAYSTEFFGEVTDKEREDHATLISRQSAMMARHLTGLMRKKFPELFENNQ